MTGRPVLVELRGPGRENLGDCTTWASLHVLGRRNDVWQWTLTTTHWRDAELMMPTVNSGGDITSNRGVVLRRVQPDGSARLFMSGWQSRYPDVVTEGGVTTWTFTGYDDTKLLANAECWPKPTSPIGSQTDTHDRRTGPASNRIRDYFIANVENRQNVDGAVGGNQLNLGPNEISKARFDNLLPLAQGIARRNVNFQVRHRETDRAMFLYQWTPPDKRASVRFSPTLGTVAGWSSTSTECTANVVIVGAGGEGVLRRFIRRADQASVNAYGPIEVFIDRRDLNPDEDPDWELQAQVAALEALEEGRARTSFAIDIRGAAGARPFVEFGPGDRVLAYADADEDQQPVGPVVDDLIEVVDVTYSATGEEGSVEIGAAADDVDNEMGRRIRDLGRRTHGLEARR